MRAGFMMSMSGIAIFGILLLLLTSKPGDWLPSLSDFFEPPEPVLVVIVGNSDLVDSVRKVISPERIIADTGDAFALVDRRVVAANSDAASGPINQLNWIHREIELVAVPMDGGRQWEKTRHQGRKAKTMSDEDREMAERIANLVRKPTLTAADAGLLLRHMDATGQF
jgi:hypothetical protein